ETALHVFAHAGEVSMVRLLLERGAEVDARDRNGSTPLHWASWAGKLDTARELLMSGADINALDKLSRSPLFGAAGGGYADVVRLLLVRGADKSLRGGKGKQTPLEKAASKRRNLVVELL
ncbi:ankyrin repeat-containing domain protein, partial [Immersiella caudata]